ncbi:hypothetical protein AVEN_187589-1 [Araneus ventricosus]|uniref:MATH domain-containing protein n=1 Tax=Araneus ventricosus TaxID=182803 RepID=A0A4Y2FUD2_ARAVE|nr:hypothetical protein AVEN_187589-1 [Araneus ventricosus]
MSSSPSHSLKVGSEVGLFKRLITRSTLSMYRRDSISSCQGNLKDSWDSDFRVEKSSESESFGIVWRIKNFTMCKLEKGKYFESPIFFAECLQNTKWSLRLYPRGEMDCDDIVCYLSRGNSSPDSIRVRYKLSVGISNQCVHQVQTFQKYSLSAVPAYARRDEVFDEVRKYPLVDILLVDCRIWNCQNEKRKESVSDTESVISSLHSHDYSGHHLSPEVLLSTMDGMEFCSREIRPYLENCCAYTIIPVERWYFPWSIKRFSERVPNQKETITVISVSESAPKILMTFFVNEQDNLEINICELTREYESSFTVNCKIHLLRIHEHSLVFNQHLHFNSKEIWKILLHVSQNDIIQRKERFLVDDELIFQCELAISYENEVSKIESCRYELDNSKRNRNVTSIISIILRLVWRYVKIFSVIFVVSFLITFALDTLT